MSLSNRELVTGACSCMCMVLGKGLGCVHTIMYFDLRMLAIWAIDMTTMRWRQKSHRLLFPYLVLCSSTFLCVMLCLVLLDGLQFFPVIFCV